MEYRLNKIDVDLRQKINDATREGKVHTAQNIAVNKDKKQQKKEKKDSELEKYPKSKKLIVDATKIENVEIEVFKEDVEIQKVSKGSFLDVKK